MIHTELSPAAALRASLLRLRKTTPFIIGESLAPVLLALDGYVDSIEHRMHALELRLQGLDKMPSPAALELLTQPAAAV
jgi:hypothetical protein